MPLILLVACSLGLIVLVFLYIFAFRLPSSQINAEMVVKLQDLYADQSADAERTSLLLRSREPKSGELTALVVWLKDYEPIDLGRQILSQAFANYFDGQSDRLVWRETWQTGDYEMVQKASQASFEAKRTQLVADGWEIVFDFAI